MNCLSSGIIHNMHGCGSFICITSKARRHRKEALCLSDAGRAGLLASVQYLDK